MLKWIETIRRSKKRRARNANHRKEQWWGKFHPVSAWSTFGGVCGHRGHGYSRSQVRQASAEVTAQDSDRVAGRRGDGGQQAVLGAAPLYFEPSRKGDTAQGPGILARQAIHSRRVGRLRPRSIARGSVPLECHPG